MHPQSIVNATVYGQCLEYLEYITLGQPNVPGGYIQGPISSSILFKLYSIGDKLFVFVNSTTW